MRITQHAQSDCTHWPIPNPNMNLRTIRKLKSLARRYEDPGSPPDLNEVESILWRAGEVADRRFEGYWPWNANRLLPSNIEDWTSQHLGWSFPCAEAVGLIRRIFRWGTGARIIDIGAGCGLWTRVMALAFGSDRVVGLDPCPKGDAIIKTTFNDWCDETGGPVRGDLLFASWLPCCGQKGSDLGGQILDRVLADHHTFVYVGSGASGPVGTSDFYDRLGLEFVEYATEPLPRIYKSVFPRDFMRVYYKRP